MPLFRNRGAHIAALLATAILFAAASADDAPSPPAIDRAVEYATDIRPILAQRCFRCHGPEKEESRLRLDQRASALRGGEWGEPAIVPGKSAESLLFKAIAGLDENLAMPPEGEWLSAQEIALIRAWIDQGAAWPDDDSDESVQSSNDHWSLQPLMRVQPPEVAAPQVFNPIDAFLLSRLRAESLDYSPLASRAAFIRRLYLDTLGLPPSPAELQTFAADDRPDAVQRLVDQVLANPRYGERWARHWLDVVRFAETSGFETNVERLTAYHYRDYVIRAFNEDKPYDQFVREQIAGDALGADAATGFLVGGANDSVKSPDPTLTLMQRQDELADMLNTTGTAFLGLTIGCARCHNHKFDPITQRDYYALQAVFAGVDHGERPLRLPDVDAKKEQLTAVESRLTALRGELARLLGLRAPVQAKVNEERFAPAEVKWVRFTVRATNNGIEPCIDELEIYAAKEGEPVNVALAAAGASATASGVYPNSEIHRLEHINDGRLGNSRSWISNTAGTGWVQIELAAPAAIDRIVWGRDREEKFQDRVPVDYTIEGAAVADEWRTLATSADRAPLGARIETAWDERIGSLAPEAQPEARALLTEAEQLQRERDALQSVVNATVYAGVFRQPGATHRLYRGDPMQPREEMAPASLEIFAAHAGPAPASGAPEQQRRLHLAGWIASAENPLTARVIVNRLWHYHFGTGLAATPSDLGKMGAAPSHPELLDWLAGELVRSGWSLKHIQRLILTSWAYRQDSRSAELGARNAELGVRSAELGARNAEPNPYAPRSELRTPRSPSAPHSALRAPHSLDSDNRLLWRFPSRRLEAEAIRDQILAVSGALDLAMYGPGFTVFQPNDNYVRVYEPKERWGPAEWRRMVYMLKVRMENEAVFGAFDCPDAGQPAPRRTASTTPLQALNLLHSSFTLQQAGLFADRLQREAGEDPSAQIERAFLLAFGREPAYEESAAALSLVREHGLSELCRVLLNANEFLFIP
jgi:hypothetical protein